MSAIPEPGKPSGLSVGRWLSGFFRWWGGELSALLPSGLRRVLGRRRPRLLLTLEERELVLARVADDSMEPLGRYPLSEHEGVVPRAITAGEPGQEVVLCLPPEQVLVKIVALPLAAEENLAEVLTFEMDRQTPFSAAQVYYDFRVTARNREKHSLEVELSLTLREWLDRILAELESLGLQPDRATFGCDQSGHFHSANLLPAAHRPTRSRARRFINGALAVLALGLLAAVLGLPRWHQKQTLENLERQLDTASRLAESSQRLQTRVEDLLKQERFVAEKKRSAPMALEVINEVTRVLPDDTWLNQLELRGGELQLWGNSSASAALIPTVESSALLQDAQFRSPITRDILSDSDRFHLSARISEEDQP